MRETISTGSMIIVPNTFSLPAVTITVMIANATKLNGKPEKIADLHLPLALREAREVAEVQQQRGEVAHDEQDRVDHRVQLLVA